MLAGLNGRVICIGWLNTAPLGSKSYIGPATACVGGAVGGVVIIVMLIDVTTVPLRVIVVPAGIVSVPPEGRVMFTCWVMVPLAAM